MRELKYAFNILFRNKLSNSLIVICLYIGITSVIVVVCHDIKTELNVWIFVGAGFMVMCIALVTVGCQGLWASMQNPVKVLRNK